MDEQMILTKTDESTSYWAPLEAGRIEVTDPDIRYVIVADAQGRLYLEQKVRKGRAIRFRARGCGGVHEVAGLGEGGEALAVHSFTLKPRTTMTCRKGPYAELFGRLGMLIAEASRKRPYIVDGKLYDFYVSWARDHTHVMKAMKYFHPDVKSGIEFFLERQQPNGMFWDDCHRSLTRPAPNWFNEALGEGYWDYSDDRQFTFRRIPIEADVEFLVTECVWYAWKASGDDAWMAGQLPRLEKALEYNASHPTRWSKKAGLVWRVFCMDSWDFKNPLFGDGDHRVIDQTDEKFLFHSDNSGLYASYWRMAEMYEALGDTKRAGELRKAGQALRKRANEQLFFDNVYGHMIPESLPADEVYDKVGDERKRMSLSTGYTINRKLPTHEMAVAILEEYRRRGQAKKHESFAEWWTMDPPYEPDQWPHAGPPAGEYMNGAICTIIAGEIARAAYEHGLEDYGTDILDRVWALSERDGGELHQAYRRLPDDPPQPDPTVHYVDLRPFANVGLKNGARKGVPAWTDEGDNDMRNLPTGKRKFGHIPFEVIDPKTNGGRGIVRLDPSGQTGWPELTVPVGSVAGKSLYFMHALAHNYRRGGVAATYDVLYADGTEHRIYIRNSFEIGLWWGIADEPDTRRHKDPVDRNVARIAWRGPNGQWKNVGLYMTGWNNPRPDVPIVGVRAAAVADRPSVARNGRPSQGGRGGVMLAAISVSDEPVKFEEPIRSYGLPAQWAQAAVYYALAEGLAGIEDTGRAFSAARVSPRWASTDSTANAVTLHYPASDGYCAYEYKLDEKKRTITLDLTGSFDVADVHCLLPAGGQARRVLVDGEELDVHNASLEGSHYADFRLDALPEGPVTIEY